MLILLLACFAPATNLPAACRQSIAVECMCGMGDACGADSCDPDDPCADDPDSETCAAARKLTAFYNCIDSTRWLDCDADVSMCGAFLE